MFDYYRKDGNVMGILEKNKFKSDYLSKILINYQLINNIHQYKI